MNKKIFWGIVMAYTLYSIIELVVPLFKYKKFDKGKWEAAKIGDSLGVEELGMADFFKEFKKGKEVHTRYTYGHSYSQPYYIIHLINGKIVDKYYYINVKRYDKN